MTTPDATSTAPARAHGRQALLEVIALTPEDARAAVQGGADRLEIVRAIDVGGLTPALEQFLAIRAAVDVPLRVMLRTNSGFRISPRELETLAGQTRALRAGGADQFVFGFLDASGALDPQALDSLASITADCPWTLHHAFDHAADAAAAWDAARKLPRLDAVLSGGVRGDLRHGLQTLRARAGWQAAGPDWLAGGGLVLDHVDVLKGAGIMSFHIGRAARCGHAWDQPVSSAAVRRWRELLDKQS